MPQIRWLFYNCIRGGAHLIRICPLSSFAIVLQNQSVQRPEIYGTPQARLEIPFFPPIQAHQPPFAPSLLQVRPWSAWTRRLVVSHPYSSPILLTLPRPGRGRHRGRARVLCAGALHACRGSPRPAPAQPPPSVKDNFSSCVFPVATPCPLIPPPPPLTLSLSPSCQEYADDALPFAVRPSVSRNLIRIMSQHINPASVRHRMSPKLNPASVRPRTAQGGSDRPGPGPGAGAGAGAGRRGESDDQSMAGRLPPNAARGMLRIR